MKIYPCVFQHKETFLENTKKYSCAGPIRKVDPNNLEVYPLYNNRTVYGAIQKGKHDFYIREKGDLVLGEALGFDHQSPPKTVI